MFFHHYTNYNRQGIVVHVYMSDNRNVTKLGKSTTHSQINLVSNTLLRIPLLMQVKNFPSSNPKTTLSSYNLPFMGIKMAATMASRPRPRTKNIKNWKTYFHYYYTNFKCTHVVCMFFDFDFTNVLLNTNLSQI